MLMAAIARICHGYRAFDILFVAEYVEVADYMRIQMLFRRGKFHNLTFNIAQRIST